jgi:hypothetical protein
LYTKFHELGVRYVIEGVKSNERVNRDQKGLNERFAAETPVFKRFYDDGTFIVRRTESIAISRFDLEDVTRHAKAQVHPAVILSYECPIRPRFRTDRKALYATEHLFAWRSIG